MLENETRKENLTRRRKESKEQSTQRLSKLKTDKIENPYRIYNPLLSKIHIFPKYVILKKFVRTNDEKIKDLLAAVKTHKMKIINTIFQGKVIKSEGKKPKVVKDKQHTRYQLQLSELSSKLNLDWIDTINNELTSLITDFFPNLEKKSHMSVLFSKKGCVEQKLHTDYPLTEDLEIQESEEDKNKASCFALVALMDNTSIILGDGKPLNIAKGDVLFSRGDLVHAGSGYEQDNVRLHVYFDNQYFAAEHPTSFEQRDSYEVKPVEEKEQLDCRKPSIDLKVATLETSARNFRVKKMFRSESRKKKKKIS
jgi:ectoine hydroxylase-related dioxygenase (phytanoyl-CoA dioxygenase family)